MLSDQSACSSGKARSHSKIHDTSFSLANGNLSAIVREYVRVMLELPVLAYLRYKWFLVVGDLVCLQLE